MAYSVGNMVHSQVEPNDEISLIKTLAIDELAEVNWWVGVVLAVVSMRASGFRILTFSD